MRAKGQCKAGSPPLRSSWVKCVLSDLQSINHEIASLSPSDRPFLVAKLLILVEMLKISIGGCGTLWNSLDFETGYRGGFYGQAWRDASGGCSGGETSMKADGEK